MVFTKSGATWASSHEMHHLEENWGCKKQNSPVPGRGCSGAWQGAAPVWMERQSPGALLPDSRACPALPALLLPAEISSGHRTLLCAIIYALSAPRSGHSACISGPSPSSRTLQGGAQQANKYLQFMPCLISNLPKHLCPRGDWSSYKGQFRVSTELRG